MKNILYTLLLLATFSVGCKKTESTAPTEEDMQEVTLSVTNLNQTIEPFSKSKTSVSAVGDTLRNYAKYLYCYMGSGRGFGPNIMTVQTADSANFGTLKFKLNRGSHVVAVFASREPLVFWTGLRWDQLRLVSRGSPANELFLLRSYTFNVTDTTDRVNIKLTRVTGAAEVNLEDAIPANASKIVLNVTNDAGTYNLTQAVDYYKTATREFVLTDAQKGQTNQKFRINLLYAYMPHVMTIQAYDQQHNLIVQKTLPEFRSSANTLTQFTGKLFSTQPESATFTITVNPIWAPDEQRVNF